MGRERQREEGRGERGEGREGREVKDGSTNQRGLTFSSVLLFLFLAVAQYRVRISDHCCCDLIDDISSPEEDSRSLLIVHFGYLLQGISSTLSLIAPIILPFIIICLHL